jgi:hypothetical protein
LALLGDFQKQERVWRQALDRAKTLAVVNIGLSPFVFWWNKIPGESFYTFGVAALMLSGLVFVFNLNHVLQRLAAMLPDETVRLETRFFGSMNLNILCALVGLTAFYLILRQIDALPDFLISVLKAMDLSRVWMSMFMILLPIAMTMTLIWKIKEVIFASVFAHRR